MYTDEYLSEVQKVDPILAGEMKEGVRVAHRPVWNSNGLTETRDLTEKEAEELELWIQGR